MIQYPQHESVVPNSPLSLHVSSLYHPLWYVNYVVHLGAFWVQLLESYVVLHDQLSQVSSQSSCRFCSHNDVNDGQKQKKVQPVRVIIWN